MKFKSLLVFLLVLSLFSIDAMRRSNAIQLKVKAPSRGLVTRWPSESADQYRGDADTNKVVSVASNMRFENGVMRNAPGYERAHPAGALLTSIVAHWKFDESNLMSRQDAVGNFPLLTAVPPDTTGLSNSVPGKIGRAAVASSDFSYETLNFPEDYYTFPGSSFTATGWIKFTTVTGSQNVFEITQGATPFTKHVLISRVANALNFLAADDSGHSDNITSSAVLASGTWYFYAIRYDSVNHFVSVRVNATEDHHANGSYTFGIGTEPAFIRFPGGDTHYIDSTSIWNRYLSNSELDSLYNSGSGLDFPFLRGKPRLLHQANLIGTPNNPLLLGTDQSLYSVARGFSPSPRTFTATLTELFTGTVSTTGYYWSATDFYDKVLFAQHDNIPQYWIDAASATYDLPGLTVNADQYSASSDGSEKFDGITSFFGHTILWKNDIVKWSDLNDFTNYIPVAATVSSATLTVATNFTQPAVGSSVNVPTTQDPSGSGTLITVGQYVRIDDTQSSQPYYNFYTVTAKNTSANVVPGAAAYSGGGSYTLAVTAGQTYTWTKAGSDTSYNNGGGDITTTPSTFVAAGSTVTLKGTNSATITATVVSGNSATLKLLGTTRRTASAATINAGKFIVTLDANEAGQAQIVGSFVNGPIFQVMPMGDYAHIFKEWSISSAQYVGAGNGVFFLRTEVTREGMIGRNAIRNLGNGSIIFLGHRELYSYQGGSNPTPVCRQYTRQLFSELDRTRLNEVAIHHNEPRNEVWVLYPVTGGQKVLIWNYSEDTATIDDYDQSFTGILAAAPVSWEVDPSWSVEPIDLLWSSVDQLKSWSDLVDLGNIETILLASGSGDLLIHGFVYNRDGAAYTALAETMDFDFGDRASFKYVDTIHFGLQVLQTDNTTRNLYVQIGTRSALDQDIVWSAAKTIAVQGNANFTAKINPGAAGGRYVRVRFYSQDTDVQWCISSYELYGRAGGTA